MLKEIEELTQKFLRGQVKQDEYLPALGVILNTKHTQLGPLRDGELLDFAKKLAHFA